MSSSNRLVLSAGGRLVVVKEGAAGSAADRLRREAAVLRQASHPGVVELVDFVELDGGGVELTTAFVAGGTLGDVADQLQPAAMVRLFAGVAKTLADLHDRGIVHGRVSTDHVLLRSSTGEPVLCGLAEARPVDEPAGAGPEADHDAEALATLVDAVTSPGSDRLTETLRRAVERCGAGAGAGAATLRSLASTLAGLVPEEPPEAERRTVSGRRLPPRRPPAPRRRGLRPVAVAGSAAVAVGSLVAVALATAGGGPSSRAAVDVPVVEAAPSSSTSTLAPTTTSTVPPPPTTGAPVRVFPPPRCPPAAPPAADVDGDGCPEAVEVSAGVVAAAGARWEVGAPEDLVVIGDWDCDGLATPAVIRPSSGHVWAFPRWAEGDEGVAAEAVEVVPAPVTEATVVSGPGRPGAGPCDGIEVVPAGGGRHLVDAAA